MRDDLVWRPAGVGVGVALAALLLLRRRQPLWAMVAALGVGHAVAVAAIVVGVPWQDLGVEVVVLAFVYSLYRHGSGREGVAGMVVLAVVWAIASLGLISPVRAGADVVASAVVLLLPAALGYAARTQVLAQRRAVDAARDEVRAAERLRLARELHDTVAHHVSAIIIQARVGRAVVAAAAAIATVLQDIEGAAQASLDELRDVVGALRDENAVIAKQGNGINDHDDEDDAAPRAPTASVKDLEALIAAEPSPTLRVTVAQALGSPSLRGAVDVAAARLIREALTNARRHARPRAGTDVVNVSVSVGVGDDDDELVIIVDDDGAPVAKHQRGHGLIGMEERVRLLGGRIAFGPKGGGGWRVEVTLPHATARSEVTS